MLSFLPIIKAVKKLKPNEYEEVCFDLLLHVFFLVLCHGVKLMSAWLLQHSFCFQAE